ncbi:DNA topoisomerase IV subunit A [Mesomycoplasma neurolyticum]|uniref:DNA topoisomerase (ATP-hydrolyzing) n=1 Tax=Mesomycoplasma neurolyticum TaxID=2120 RepID=A0A449A6Q5_9BACT|nr:DNA gyrase subunit A [Mesomycoplasma neurolyticum]
MSAKYKDFLNKSLDDVISSRFARYSKYIIQQRALPDARDGLKPVQRRILYSMWELNLKNDKPFKKSARVVGDVIGKYHPHGDSSIYEAMIRMGQEWKMNIPLIEIHGNKGSIDDDPAAAMRYTEARLANISTLLLESLSKNTVEFVPNFDDTEVEPVILPSLIPNLLLNGAKGIASGFATEIPPHNLGEILDAAIAKINNSAIEIRKLFKIIKGPDFPTGGVIYGKTGIYDAFEKGQGKIVLVSKYKIIDNLDRKAIEIFEIPFGVVKSKLVKDIDEICIDKKINGIKEVIDQSDRNGISILIELTKDAKITSVLNYLLKKTEMQIYYSYNSVAIEKNAPKLMSLNDMLTSYISHIKEFKTRELTYNFQVNQKRLEIVNALIKVSEITDEVIKIIRNSDNSKKGVIEALIKEFNFNENQATAIAEMQLYRLSRIDQIAYAKEQNDLEIKIKEIDLLLNNENEFNKFLVKNLLKIKEKYATPRKTEILDEELKIELKTEELIKKEDFYLAISKEGYIKKLTIKTFETNKIENYVLKEKDSLIFLSKVNSLNKLLIFTNTGKYIFLPLHKIEENKWKDFGSHINDYVLLKSNEKIIKVFAVENFENKNFLVLITAKGIGKKVALKDFEVSRFNKTIQAIKFKNSLDYLVDVKMSDNFKDVVIISSEMKVVKYSELEIPTYNTNSSGVSLINLPKNEKVQAFCLTEENENIFFYTLDGYFKKVSSKLIPYTSKKVQGKQIFNLKQKQNTELINMISSSEKDLEFYVFYEQNKIAALNTSNLTTTSLNNNFSYKMPNTNIHYVSSFADNLITSLINKNNLNDDKLFEFTEKEKKEKEQKRILSAEEKLKKLEDLDIESILKKFN